jgi:hypothetical protein
VKALTALYSPQTIDWCLSIYLDSADASVQSRFPRYRRKSTTLHTLWNGHNRRHITEGSLAIRKKNRTACQEGDPWREGSDICSKTDRWIQNEIRRDWRISINSVITLFYIDSSRRSLDIAKCYENLRFDNFARDFTTSHPLSEIPIWIFWQSDRGYDKWIFCMERILILSLSFTLVCDQSDFVIFMHDYFLFVLLAT